MRFLYTLEPQCYHSYLLEDNIDDDDDDAHLLSTHHMPCIGLRTLLLTYMTTYEILFLLSPLGSEEKQKLKCLSLH